MIGRVRRGDIVFTMLCLRGRRAVGEIVGQLARSYGVDELYMPASCGELYTPTSCIRNELYTLPKLQVGVDKSFEFWRGCGVKVEAWPCCHTQARLLAVF